MKKLIAVLLCLLMLCPCAFAENAATVLNWEDGQQSIASRGLTGEITELPEIGIRIWLPAGYEKNNEAGLQEKAAEIEGDTYEGLFAKILDSYHQELNVSQILMFTGPEGSRQILTLEQVGPGIPAETVPEDATQMTVNGMRAAVWKKAMTNLAAFFNPNEKPTNFYVYAFVYTDDENGIGLNLTEQDDADSKELTELLLCILSSVQPLE